MWPLTRAWLPACFTVLLLLGSDHRAAAAAQEPDQASSSQPKGEGVYDAVEGTTTIVSIKPLGSRVNKGELVCELESFGVRTRLAKQEIAAKAALAPYEYARRTREIAELGITEYVEGIYRPQLRSVERQIAVAEVELRKAEQSLAATKNLVEKGLALKSQADAATLGVQQARLALETAQRKKTTLERFTKEKKVKQLQGKVERARAEELARQANYGREQAAEDQLKKQIERCKLMAPASGRVIYAEEIEEGAEVSQGQLLFRVVPEGEPKGVK